VTVECAAFFEPIHCSSQVWACYGVSHHQAYVESFEELCIRYAFLNATYYVVGDAVIASQHKGGHQTKQFLDLYGKGPLLIGAGVEVEESLNLKVSGTQYLAVHPLTVLPELGDRIAFISQGRSVEK